MLRPFAKRLYTLLIASSIAFFLTYPVVLDVSDYEDGSRPPKHAL